MNPVAVLGQGLAAHFFDDPGRRGVVTKLFEPFERLPAFEKQDLHFRYCLSCSEIAIVRLYPLIQCRDSHDHGQLHDHRLFGA